VLRVRFLLSVASALRLRALGPLILLEKMNNTDVGIKLPISYQVAGAACGVPWLLASGCTGGFSFCVCYHILCSR